MLNLFSSRHCFALLIAPPASGKTSFLFNLVAEYPHFNWVFISPLKALASEFEQRDRTGSFVVLTAEKMLQTKYQHLLKASDVVFVLDEFHLIYEWGTEFRDSLMQAWFIIGNSSAHVIGLTATWNPERSEVIKRDLTLNFSESYLIDCGNLMFRYPPGVLKWTPAKSRSWDDLIEIELMRVEKKNCSLIFVPYREMVDELEARAKHMGINVIGCKGGEVENFCMKLEDHWEDVELIISTSCLSHGVNLPQFKRIYITYEVNDLFWLQMAARGGRRGEGYELYSCKRSRSVIIEHLLFYFRVIKNKILLCYLREYLFISRLIRNVI